MTMAKPLPGQHLLSEAGRHLLSIQDLGIRCYSRWVPGHVEVRGNERADQLAKEGTQKKKQESDTVTTITHLKQQVKEHTLPAWTA